jgi:MerR family transcriptional regulator, light-induced transcriptional regulator
VLIVNKSLSPKQVARAIGVSESSLKRWCDQGLISTVRTAGGHRRLPVDAVLAFLRESGQAVVEPEVLGLPATTGKTQWTVNRATELLRNALVTGDEEVCRQIVLDLYLARHPMSVICDQALTRAFHDIGDLWKCGDVEVFEERRACDICTRLVHELCRLLPPAKPAAPLAEGGTLDGDPYTLASSMAELVLRDNGWNSISLGNGLPFATLHTALTKTHPRLLWLSVSAIRDEDRFADEMNALFDQATQLGTALVLGGVALADAVRRSIRFSAYCDTFQHLEAFSKTLLGVESRKAGKTNGRRA